MTARKQKIVIGSCERCGGDVMTNRPSLKLRFCSRSCASRAQQRKRQDLGERFWSHVERGPADACWPWRGARHPFGHGTFNVNIDGRRFARAHRVAWELTNGPIPEGLYVCHRCDNPPCCNPDHLFLGTAHDNSRDMMSKGRGGGQFQPGSGLVHMANARYAGELLAEKSVNADRDLSPAATKEAAA